MSKDGTRLATNLRGLFITEALAEAGEFDADARYLRPGVHIEEVEDL